MLFDSVAKLANADDREKRPHVSSLAGKLWGLSGSSPAGVIFSSFKRDQKGGDRYDKVTEPGGTG